ncbi:hypothetical protein MO328_08560 [Xanthomonas translucens]|uniref:hypothetical protein n=1 Tax=Xanthomonas campestris pv. translucens TaxID=343 RepID=UPI0027154EA3|nr:hypothetical protein [Xanthomonas translucens]WLA10133.1 hypothetical protein MO328_08560 [Xanthomonas translucens]
MRHIEIVRSKRSTPSPEDANKTSSKRSWSITTLIGSIAAMTTLAGIVLHGCGHVAYTSYLNAWGVQADLFPQSTDWKVIRGYYAVVLEGIGVIHSVPWLVLLLAFFLLWLAVWVYRFPARPTKGVRMKEFGRRHPSIMLVLSSGGIAASGIYLATTLFFVGLFVSVLPGFVGEHAGKKKQALSSFAYSAQCRAVIRNSGRRASERSVATSSPAALN